MFHVPRLCLLALLAPLAACATADPGSAAFDPALALSAARSEHAAFPPPGAAFTAIVEGRPTYLALGAEAADRPAPVTDETVFQIASLTKPFTAIVILRLAEQRRLRLDDRAAQWLDWLPPAYRDVTLRQLLSHTSGVPRDLRRENVDEFPIEEFRRRFLAAEPSFAPGARWEYSNTGYILLFLVAERAGQSSFGALLDSLIFRPLGMRRTRYRAPLSAGPGRAVGYDWVEGRWQAAPPVHAGFGNSGIESTAADLARFARALQRRRLLRPESYAAMLTPSSLSSGAPVEFPFRDVRASYGLGWFLTDYCGARIATHGGTIAGFSSGLFWAVDRDAATVALANGKSGPDRIGLADKIAAAAMRALLSCGAGAG